MTSTYTPKTGSIVSWRDDDGKHRIGYVTSRIDAETVRICCRAGVYETVAVDDLFTETF